MTLHDDCSPRTIAIHEPFAIHLCAQGCHMWQCPKCGPVNKRKLIELAVSGQPNRFLTLTMPPTPHMWPDWDARKMRKAWALLTRRWARHKGTNKIEHLTTFERHKSGAPHLHILLRCAWIDVEWVRNQWRKLTRGEQIKLEYIDNPRKAAAYVAKYMAKDPHKFAYSKRFSRSQGWVVATAPKPWVSPYKGMPAEIIHQPYQPLAAVVEYDDWRVYERRGSSLSARSQTHQWWYARPP